MNTGREGGGRSKQVEGEERLRRVWGEVGGYAGWLGGCALCHGATQWGSAGLGKCCLEKSPLGHRGSVA